MTNPQIKKVAFTFDYAGITTTIHTKCGINKSLEKYNDEILNSAYNFNFTAVWDTGATKSAISKNVADTLGLLPTGTATMEHAYGKVKVNTFDVSIFLPNKLFIPSIKVLEGIFDGCDILIGMDIITAGDFVITSPEQKTKFSFQVPSTHDIDFNKELQENK
jgi:hypothetical protein